MLVNVTMFVGYKTQICVTLKRDKERHGADVFSETGEKGNGSSACSFMGGLDCEQHGISTLSAVGQVIARALGSVCDWQ